MLGQGMLGAGPTMTATLGIRTAMDPHLRRWGLAGLIVGVVELALGWFWLWPATCSGASVAS